MEEIYLDNAASTPLDPRVLETLIYASKVYFGNPSNTRHHYGRTAAQALEKARVSIGTNLALDPQGIIFTSGATEANNLALRGLGCLQNKCTVLISQLEHPCIDESAKFLLKRGIKVLTIPTQVNGVVHLPSLEALIAATPDIKLISVMLVNNETGVIQPIQDIIRLARKKGILVHTDAAQGIGKVDPASNRGVDMVSISAHKINGPKGIGCLWMRPDLSISPLLVGGGQEKGIRSGTTPVPLILAFAKAVEISRDTTWLPVVGQGMASLEVAIRKAIPECGINGYGAPRVATTVNISFPFNTPVINVLQGVAASMGAACGCDKPEPSKVLTAMGSPPKLAKNCLRISAGRTNTLEDIIKARELIIIAAKKAQQSN